MSLLDPASISLGEEEQREQEEEERRRVPDSGCVPAVGASVIIDEHAAAAAVQRSRTNSESCSMLNDRINRISSDHHPSRLTQIRSVCQVIPKTKSIADVHGTPSRINADQITDSIYSDFVILMTGGEVVPPNDEYRQILDGLVQGDDYTIACDVDDEFLGHLDYVIVHLPSMRLLLTSEQREQVMESAVARFKNDKHPIGACLQLLQKNYIGFPPVIKLRNALLDCLSRLMTVGEDDLEYAEPVLNDPGAEGYAGEVIPIESVLPGADSIFAARKRAAFTNLLNSPIPDSEYDILAQVLTRKIKVEDLENVVLKEAVKERMKGGLLVGEYWSEPHDFLSSGWRIRLRDSGKIVPRTSEVDEIWRRCFEAMPDCTQKQMLAYLDERYAGINSRTRHRVPVKDILLRGSRVQFPCRPRCIGSKPMQYVQIDMVEMECSEYGDRCYTMALIVTDLYSHFVFGRALAEAPDTSLLVRHLMDIFGAFSPPEAYRTYTNDEVIAHVMSDIEKLFKIEIRNTGHGVMIHANLCASMYKRAAEELGGRERWVEALPFAVIDYNQTPIKCFGGIRISPFEIMFGRRPWRNDCVPPWVRSDLYGESDNETKGYMEENHTDKANKGNTAEINMLRPALLPRRPEVEQRLANAFLTDMSSNRAKISCVFGRYPAKFNSEGHVIDPGTGYLYDVGDCVYLRSFEQDQFTNRTKRRQNEPRYYRATIVEIDYRNPDFMYRVCYWDHVMDVDCLAPDQWPDEGALTAWVSPYDIAPSTVDLARRRNVVRRREMEFQCKCGFDFCDFMYSPDCPYKLSQACCLRLKMNCPYHAQIKPPATRESSIQLNNPGVPVLKLSGGGERRLLTLPRRTRNESDHSNSRWVFHGDRYIELFPSSSNTSVSSKRDNNIHFDYDIGALSAKKRRIQASLFLLATLFLFDSGSSSNYMYDGGSLVSKVPSERPYEFQTVEFYESKDNLLLSNTHELEELDVDDESIDVASSRHDNSATPPEVSDHSVFLSREPKTIGEAEDSKLSGSGSGTLQTESSPVRSTKRISAPPRRLSPT